MEVYFYWLIPCAGTSSSFAVLQFYQCPFLRPAPFLARNPLDVVSIVVALLNKKKAARNHFYLKLISRYSFAWGLGTLSKGMSSRQGAPPQSHSSTNLPAIQLPQKTIFLISCPRLAVEMFFESCIARPACVDWILSQKFQWPTPLAIIILILAPTISYSPIVSLHSKTK